MSPFAHPLDLGGELAVALEFDGEAADRTALYSSRDNRLTPLNAMFRTAQVNRLGTFAITGNSALKYHFQFIRGSLPRCVACRGRQ